MIIYTLFETLLYRELMSIANGRFWVLGVVPVVSSIGFKFLAVSLYKSNISHVCDKIALNPVQDYWERRYKTGDKGMA